MVREFGLRETGAGFFWLQVKGWVRSGCVELHFQGTDGFNLAPGLSKRRNHRCGFLYVRARLFQDRVIRECDVYGCGASAA